MWQVDDVWFRYRDANEWVLTGVSLEIGRGEIVGLAGPSGVGKSTLGRVMSGLLQPGHGAVRADGAPIEFGPGRPSPAQLVLQHPERAMNPQWKIGAVLAEADADLRATLDGGLVLEEWLQRYPHELSGGQLQRVSLARSLSVAPPYLVADEITSSVDAITQVMVWHAVRRRVEAGMGVLAVSHDRALLRRVAHRVMTIDEISRADVDVAE